MCNAFFAISHRLTESRSPLAPPPVPCERRGAQGNRGCAGERLAPPLTSTPTSFAPARGRIGGACTRCGHRRTGARQRCARDPRQHIPPDPAASPATGRGGWGSITPCSPCEMCTGPRRTSRTGLHRVVQHCCSWHHERHPRLVQVAGGARHRSLFGMGGVCAPCPPPFSSGRGGGGGNDEEASQRSGALAPTRRFGSQGRGHGTVVGQDTWRWGLNHSNAATPGVGGRGGGGTTSL